MSLGTQTGSKGKFVLCQKGDCQSFHPIRSISDWNRIPNKTVYMYVHRYILAILKLL